MNRITIRRGDGLGNQVGNRLFAKLYYDRNPLIATYFHSKIQGLAHLSSDSSFTELYNYIFHTLTGLNNDIEVGGLDSANSITNIKNNFNPKGEEEPTIFCRSEFSSFSSHFISNSDFNIYDRSKFNVVLHIRRGDEYENTLKNNTSGRILDLDYYKKIVSLCRENAQNFSKELQFYIETDSPKLISSFAEEIGAKVNAVSEYARRITEKPYIKIKNDLQLKSWQKTVYAIQALYNISSSDLFIASHSAFSNLAFLLSATPTITSLSFFARFSLSDLNPDWFLSKTLPQRTEEVKWLEHWGAEANQQLQRIGPLYKVYNYYFSDVGDLIADGNSEIDILKIINMINNDSIT